MSAPDIPNPWSFYIHTDDDLLSDIHIKEMPTIKLETTIKEPIPVIKTESKMEAKTDNKIDAKTDSVISIKELPRIDLQFGLRPQRYHMPVNLRFGMSIMGMQLLSFDICGETMFVSEDYKAHKSEECE
jgi:hypothetical protein